MLGMAAVTYALRASFLLLPENAQLPALLRRALRYVPAAVLTAMVSAAAPRSSQAGPDTVRSLGHSAPSAYPSLVPRRAPVARGAAGSAPGGLRRRPPHRRPPCRGRRRRPWWRWPRRPPSSCSRERWI